MRVETLDLSEPVRSQRWAVGEDGSCADPVEHELGTQPPGAGPYLLNPWLVDLVRPRLNDFQIYTLLCQLSGREAASRYLDGCAAEHRSTAESGCQLVVLFNHHYARNCRALHDFYVERFPEIDFVLPCAAPRHPNYHAYPFGSYQFHGLVQGYLRDRLRKTPAQTRAYMFIQDDVLLHPRLSATSVLDLLSHDRGGLFPFDYPYTLQENRWAWSERVLNALDRQRDKLTGNGFEGLFPAITKRRLHHGVSDCFAVRSDLVPEFVERLAPMVAANLFPEVAIPTALFSTVRRAGLSMAIQPGSLLWGADREKVRDAGYIKEFLASEAAFLHPLKIAKTDSEILQLVQSSGS